MKQQEKTESRIAFAIAITIILAVIAIYGIGAAFAAEVVSAKSDDTYVRAHDGYAPHQHTRQQFPEPDWQRLAHMDIDKVSPGDVWHALAEAAMLYHQAPTLSVSLRIIACPRLPDGTPIDLPVGGLPSGAPLDLPGILPAGDNPLACKLVLRTPVLWVDRGDKYFEVSGGSHWVVPEGAPSGAWLVLLEARLLSIPRDGDQGHKVFMTPGKQWMSIAVL